MILFLYAIRFEEPTLAQVLVTNALVGFVPPIEATKGELAEAYKTIEETVKTASPDLVKVLQTQVLDVKAKQVVESRFTECAEEKMRKKELEFASNPFHKAELILELFVATSYEKDNKEYDTKLITSFYEALDKMIAKNSWLDLLAIYENPSIKYVLNWNLHECAGWNSNEYTEKKNKIINALISGLQGMKKLNELFRLGKLFNEEDMPVEGLRFMKSFFFSDDDFDMRKKDDSWASSFLKNAIDLLQTDNKYSNKILYDPRWSEYCSSIRSYYCNRYNKDIAALASCIALTTFQEEQALDMVEEAAQPKRAFEGIWTQLTSEEWDKIKKIIKDIFSKGIISKYSETFGKHMWAGAPFVRLSQDNIPQYGRPPRIETFQSDISLSYREFPAINSVTNAVVIELYGGYSKDFPNSSLETVGCPMCPLAKDMATIWLELGDRDFEISQGAQLSEDHFEQTHALLLKRTSDFVAYIKSQHPQAKIFLKGHSFGGFFVTSYALLQSVGVDNSVYKDFAFKALQLRFGVKAAGKVNGVIGHAGGLNRILAITKSPSFDAFQKIKVPMLLHFNFDDERVTWEDQFPAVMSIDENCCDLLMSRVGARQFVEEFSQEKLEATSWQCSLSTLRGHFYNITEEYKFQKEIIFFIEKYIVNPKNYAETQKKRRKLYTRLRPPSGFTYRDQEVFWLNITADKSLFQSLDKTAAFKGITLPHGVSANDAFKSFDACSENAPDKFAHRDVEYFWSNLCKDKMDVLKGVNIPVGMTEDQVYQALMDWIEVGPDADEMD